MTQTINVSGLTDEQIREIKSIILLFQAQNRHTNSYLTDQPELNANQIEAIDITDLFFASEILTPFNRSILYGQRR